MNEQRGRTKPPTQDVAITFAICEDTNGKLSINAQVPDHAAGTIALLLADIAMKMLREAMSDLTGQKPPMEERRLQ